MLKDMQLLLRTGEARGAPRPDWWPERGARGQAATDGHVRGVPPPQAPGVGV